MKERPARGRAKKPNRGELKELYEIQGLTLREIAQRLDVHFETVRRWIKDYGIKTRSRVRHSSLERFTLSALKDGISKYGVRGFAQRLQIHESTLRQHLNKRVKGKSE